MRASVICATCGAQCCAEVAAAHGWTDSGCPKCPPTPSEAEPHPLVVNFAWSPDYPDHDPTAERGYTAACGCGWRSRHPEERDAWVAALGHAGRLAGWEGRPLLERPRPDAGRSERRAQLWRVEAERLLGVPMRSAMACGNDGSGRTVHPCRGVIPPDDFGPGELCVCGCHDQPHRDPEPCRHCAARSGHFGSCPTRTGGGVSPVPPDPQLSLF